MKKMKKIILFCLSATLVLQACEPNRECTNPKCISSPILLSLKANFSNNDSVLHVGDTLKMVLKIPDTLNTNQGLFYIKSVQKVQTTFQYYAADSFGIAGRAVGLPNIFVRKGSDVNLNRSFNLLNNKELEILFIPSKKTNYYISASPQLERLEITDKSGVEYLIMFTVDFDVKDDHHLLYASWLPSNQRADFLKGYPARKSEGIGFYAFKVE